MPTTRALHDMAVPWLVGYDAHGIQEFVTASNRPLAMLGASASITGFDRRAAESAAHPVFAGGGRGIEVVDGEAAAHERCARLSADYAATTFGGAMSTAAVPFDHANEPACIRWLRQRLDLAKDACAPPGHGALSLYYHKSDQCADCGTYLAEHPSERRDGGDERVCTRCRDMTRAGRAATAHQLGEQPQSLLDVVDDEYIAAVSIDGNNLGALFLGLDTLAATRDASQALGLVFSGAHERARLQLQGRHVHLATGGDDIRLFLPQSQVLAYLDVLIPELHAHADREPSLRNRRAHFGVGVGVALADPHLPAKRLMEYAHDLERSAKRRCRPGDASVRSALDFAILTAGDASRIDPFARREADGRPIAFGSEWDRLKTDAAELALLPSSQLALLRGAPDMASHDFAEFANAWRYQLARSAEWQSWYDRTGRDWRDPDKAVAQRPCAVHLDLLHFLPRPHASA